MRNVLLCIFLLTGLVNCQSERTPKPLTPAACNDPKFTRARSIENVEAFIIERSFTTGTGGKSTSYYISQPDGARLSIPWVACNLPESYQKDKLAVRISGYILTYPGMERENRVGSPIELTQIAVR